MVTNQSDLKYIVSTAKKKALDSQLKKSSAFLTILLLVWHHLDLVWISFLVFVGSTNNSISEAKAVASVFNFTPHIFFVLTGFEKLEQFAFPPFSTE